MNRTHRAEVYSPDGRWVFGEWVDAGGYGHYVDRLERAARQVLASEPSGSTARVFRYHARSKSEPFTEVLAVTLP